MLVLSLGLSAKVGVFGWTANANGSEASLFAAPSVAGASLSREKRDEGPVKAELRLTGAEEDRICARGGGGSALASLGGTGGATVSSRVLTEARLLDFFEAKELDRELGREMGGGEGKWKSGGKGQRGGVLGALLLLPLLDDLRG